MSQQQAVELLPDQVRGFAPQDNAGSSQMGFEFIESSLSGKGLARC
jgi:hypothetical protein